MMEFDIKWKQQLDAAIEEEMGNPDFTLDDLAATLTTSSAQLHRKVKKLTGESPGNYIRKKRLEKAKEMLERGIYPTISEVAIAVGFQPSDYFSVIFEREYGIRPIEYLKRKE